MPIALPKGGNCSLNAEEHPGGKLLIAMGYSVPSETSTSPDIDASAFLLGEDGRVRGGSDFIFYNQPSDEESKFICLLESARPAENPDAGSADESDRVRFSIDLDHIPADVQRIVFCLTMHEAEKRQQNFGCVDRVYLRILNRTQNSETVRFEAVREFTSETALQVSELYRRGGEWKFRAVGQGYAGGLAALATSFGVHLEQAEDDDCLPPPPRREDNDEASNFETVPPSISSGSLDIEPPSKEEMELPSLSKKKRRTSAEILAGQTQQIAGLMKPFLPQIALTLRAAANESSTRILLDRILQQVLGYELHEIKAEHKIQGRTADYVLAPGGVDAVVIEVKRIGAPLKQKQIFQATSY
ncbi:MAG TPA: TerD family protein, partial [Verrucomicrobium sp.]|nr:TerD family protein [Verrucomicrobium sp.]